MNDMQPLGAELRRAEQTLKSTLDEACSADVVRADTGELIKVEEMLAIASDAAKRAISIRRKRKQGAPSAERKRGTRSLLDPIPADLATAVPPPEQRTFRDDAEVEWTVRAVHPIERADAKHARLLGSFQQGWLAFECEASKRRLSPIPPEWTALDTAGLRALCAQAEEASSRRPDDQAR